MKRILLLLIFCATLYPGFAQTTIFSSPSLQGKVGKPYLYYPGASDGNLSLMTYSAQTLPSWLTFTAGSVNASFGSVANAGGIAVAANGDVYVANVAGGTISRISSGITTPVITSGIPGAIYDLEIIGNNLYVSQLGGAAQGLLKYDLSNLAAGSTSVFNSDGVTGLTQKDGFLYFISYNNHTIYKLDPATNGTTVYPVTGILSAIIDLAFMPNGTLLLSDGTPDLNVWDGTTLSIKNVYPSVYGILTDEMGHVYLSSAGGFETQIFRYDSDLTNYSILYNTVSGSYDMGLNNDGGVIIGDYDNNAVALVNQAAIKGTPTSADIGSHPVALSATNGTSIGNQNFNIAVSAAANNALAFNGTNPNRIRINSPTTTFNFGTGDFTLEAWIKTTDPTLSPKLILGNYSGSGNDYWLGMLNGRVNFSISGLGIQGTTLINDGKWHHLAGVRQAGIIYIYVDGVNQASLANTRGASPSSNLTIGNFGTLGYPWLGTIDEVRVYNSALSAANVIADMTSTTAVVPPNLVAHFDMNQGIPEGNNITLTTLNDLSANALTATLLNFDLTAGNSTSNYVGSYALVIPVATAASAIQSTSFTANWTAPANGTADSYRLDVATDADFTNIIQSLTVTSGTAQVVTGLTASTPYYYRVRAFSNTLGEGVSSNGIQTQTALAPPGNALNFTGVEKVQIANGVVLPATFTQEVWIKPSSTDGAYHGILGAGDNNGTGRSPVIYVFNNTGLHGGFGDGNLWYNYTLNNVLKSNAWNHVAQTFDGAVFIVYVNGVEVYRNASWAGAIPNQIPLQYLGQIDNNFQGSMDEVRLWNITRTAQEIAANYNKIISSAPGLVAYYDFDNGNANLNNAGVTNLEEKVLGTANGTLQTFALNGTSSNWVGSYAVVTPVAQPASAVTANSFTANWLAPITGTAASYVLDVAYNPAFSSMVSGYDALPVNGLSQVVAATPGTKYYYRVRAVNASGEIGGYSQVIATQSTLPNPPGNALAFDGTNVIDVPTSELVAGNFTVEAWIKPADLSNFAIFGTRNTNGNAFDFQLYQGRIHGDIGSGAGFYTTSADATYAYTANRWMHIAYSVSTTGYRIYANGELVGSGTYGSANPLLFNANSSFRIGGNYNDPSFKGSMDELRIYKSALTQAEIQADMVSTTASVPANLVAYYNFDQGIPAGNNTSIPFLNNQTSNLYQGPITGFNRGAGNITSNFVGSYALVVPVANAATALTNTGFSTSWTAPNAAYGAADSYYFDLATDANFNNPVAAYSDLQVTTGTSLVLTGLGNNTNYFYRVRAFNNALNVQSGSSNVIAVTTKTTQTLTFTSPNATKTYGDADFPAGASSSNTAIAITYTSSDTNVATVATDGTVHIVGAGVATLTASQAGDATHEAAAPVTQTLTINKKVLTVTAVASNKVYDQTNTATVTFSDDRVTNDVFGIAYTSATFDNKNAGTAKPVTVTGISITGTAANNYTFNNTAAASADITPRTLTVTATGNDKVYDGNTSAYADLWDDHINGDIVNLNAMAEFVDKNVGAGKVVNVTSISLSGTDANNYTANSSTSTTANITAKAIAVTATAGQTKVYGTADPVFNYTFNPALITGDSFSGALSRAGGENIGTAYAITQGSLLLSGNYALSYSGANFSITAKPIKVIADAKTKEYGSADPALTYTTNVPLIAGDAFTGNISRTVGENVGTYAINKNTLALSSNYTVSYTSADLTVTKKVLTITADNKVKFQGTANPTLTASYAGFISGENNSNLIIQPALSTTATNASVAGTYPINVNAATSNNYAITFVPGTLTVTSGIPTSLRLAQATVFENRAAGTTAGTFSSTSEDPGASFTYTLVAGTGSADNGAFSISGNQLLTAQSFDFETKNSYSIRVRTTTQYGLSLENTFTINISDVNEIPTLNAISDQAICYTSSTQTVGLTGITAGPETAQSTTISVLSNNPNLFATLSVSKNGAAGTLTYSAKAGASGTATVTVTVQDNGGTANGGTDTYTRTFTITVFALPTPAISSNKGNAVGKGETIQLTATGGISYVWAANSSIISGQNTATLTVRPSVTTTFTVTATNANGCSASTSFTIEVESDYTKLKSTNLLTPNNDGINDKWVITNIDLYGNNEAKVFDVAGRLVYSKKNYDNSWDGTFNGAPLSEGTYYYIVDFGAGKGKLKGFITIIREQ